MYCKKCGKDYPKTKKVCKECGIALTPGKSPGKKKNSNKSFIITGIAVLVVITAVFLIIGLGGMIPRNLNGVWSWTDQSGLSSSLEFKSGGAVEWKTLDIPTTGNYTYNESTGEGNVYIGPNKTEHAFTCNGATLVIDGNTYTK